MNIVLEVFMQSFSNGKLEIKLSKDSGFTIEEHKKLFRLNGIDRDQYIDTFLHTKPVYDSFDAFLKDCE